MNLMILFHSLIIIVSKMKNQILYERMYEKIGSRNFNINNLK
jgi:hypothetical protein